MATGFGDEKVTLVGGNGAELLQSMHTTIWYVIHLLHMDHKLTANIINQGSFYWSYTVQSLAGITTVCLEPELKKFADFKVGHNTRSNMWDMRDIQIMQWEADAGYI